MQGKAWGTGTAELRNGVRAKPCASQLCDTIRKWGPDHLVTTVARQQGLGAKTGHCRLTVTRLQALLPVLSIQGGEMVPEPWASRGRGDQAGPGIRSCPSELGTQQ